MIPPSPFHHYGGLIHNFKIRRRCFTRTQGSSTSDPQTAIYLQMMRKIKRFIYLPSKVHEFQQSCLYRKRVHMAASELLTLKLTYSFSPKMSSMWKSGVLLFHHSTLYLLHILNTTVNFAKLSLHTIYAIHISKFKVISEELVTTGINQHDSQCAHIMLLYRLSHYYTCYNLNTQSFTFTLQKQKKCFKCPNYTTHTQSIT